MKKMNFYFNALSNRVMLTIAGLALLLCTVNAQSALRPNNAITDGFVAPNVAGPTPTTIIAGAFSLVGHGGNFDPQLPAFTGDGTTITNFVSASGSASGTSAQGRLRVLKHATGASGLDGSVAFNLNNMNLSALGGSDNIRMTVYQGSTTSTTAPYSYPVATKTVASFVGNFNDANELVATGLCPGVYRVVVEALNNGAVLSTFNFNFVTVNTSGIAFNDAGWNNPLLDNPGVLAGGIDNVAPTADVKSKFTLQLPAGKCDSKVSLAFSDIENALPGDNITPVKGLYRFLDVTNFTCGGYTTLVPFTTTADIVTPIAVTATVAGVVTDFIAGATVPAGALFLAGATVPAVMTKDGYNATVHYIVIDGDGNTTVKDIVVTVKDEVAPIVTDCPTGPIVAALDNTCASLAASATIKYTDNCGILAFGAGSTLVASNGQVAITGILPTTDMGAAGCGGIKVGIPANTIPGLYPVVLTFVDAAGNKTTCSFSFLVPAIQTLVCQANANISLAGCDGNINAAQLATGFCDPILTPIAGLVQIQRAGLWTTVSPVTGSVGTITSADFGKTFAYRVLEGSHMCWGNVRIEDKQIPVVTAPADITLACTDNPLDTKITGDIAGARNANSTVTNDGSFGDCSKVDQTYTDVTEYSSDCLAYNTVTIPVTVYPTLTVEAIAAADAINAAAGAIVVDLTASATANVVKVIARTWAVKDVWGNVSASETQYIFVLKDPRTYVDVETPAAKDCDVTDYTPATLNSYPFLYIETAGVRDGFSLADADVKGATIKPGETVCGISVTYTDGAKIALCGNGFKVVRTWTVMNMCAANTVEDPMSYTLTQILQFTDTKAPDVSVTYDSYNLVDDKFCANINGMPMDLGKKVNKTTVKSTFGSAATIELKPLSSSSTCNMASVSLVLKGSDPKCGTTVRYTSSDSRVTLNTASVANGTVVIATGTFMRSSDPTVELPSFTITAYDACGNATPQKFSVNITDNVSPNTVCKVNSTATVAADGSVRAYASSFDNGSTDACGIDRILVRRMTVAGNLDCGVVNQVNNTDACFYEYVDFTCGDVNDGQIQVVLRTIDQAGNYSDCMVNITVVDKTGPTCVSAPDKKMNCAEIPTDINTSFDVPSAYDNCGFTVATQPVALTLNCGAGSVTKSWTFTDCGGNTSVCTQKITVIGMQGFSAVPLADITTTCAYTPNLAADEAAILASVQKMCGTSVQVTSSQVIYNGTVGQYCRKYIQTFMIIDMCNPASLVSGIDVPVIRGTVARQTAGPDGKMIFERTVIVNDANAPISSTIPNTDTCIVIGCNYNYTTTLTANDACNTVVAGAPTDILYYNYTVKNSAGAVLASQVALASASGAVISLSNLVFGEVYTVSYSVADACLNTSVVKTFTIKGKDCKAPQVLVHNKVVELAGQTGVRSTGMAELKYADIKNNVTDNCDGDLTNSSKITMEVGGLTSATAPTAVAGTQSIMFTCADLYAAGGTAVTSKNIEVRVWAKDGSGNWNYAISTITLQDNIGICNNILTVNVTGGALTEGNASVANVAVSASVNGASVATANAVNGTFTLAVAPSANVQVRAAKTNNDDAAAGVTTFDIAKVSQHVLDIEKLATAYKLIAADVDKSGVIDALDMLHMRRFILKITPSLPGGNFRFVNKAYSFRNASDPFGEDFPEVVNIASLSANTSANFVAVKLGDVNDSYAASAVRSARSLTFNVNDMNVVAGNEYTVNISADKMDAAAFQGTFSFAGATVKTVKAGNLTNMTDGNFGIFANAVTTSWNGKTQASADVMTITFVANKSGKLSDMLTVNSALTQSVANDAAGNEMNVALKFNTGKVAGGEFALYQNQPNPVANETTIGFNLPKDGQARLTISGVDGKVVKVINGDYKAGFNSLTINKSDLKVSGVFYYKLETADYSAAKKMVIVE